MNIVPCLARASRFGVTGGLSPSLISRAYAPTSPQPYAQTFEKPLSDCRSRRASRTRVQEADVEDNKRSPSIRRTRTEAPWTFPISQAGGQYPIIGQQENNIGALGRDKWAVLPRGFCCLHRTKNQQDREETSQCHFAPSHHHVIRTPDQQGSH